MNSRIVKIILAFLLFLCLFDMPYWYYQVIRIFGTIGLVYLAWFDYKLNIKLMPLIFGVGAILFNPIIKISFDRDAWQVIDVLFTVILILSLMFEKLLKKYLKNG